MDKLRAFNTEWNDLPRRLVWIVVIIGCLLLLLLAFPYVAPFVLAAVFAWMIDPAVRFLTRLVGGSKAARNVFSALFVLLLVTAVTVIVFLLVNRVFSEIRALALALPGWFTQASGDVLAWLEGLELDWPIFSEGVETAVLRLLADATSMITSALSGAAAFVARSAIRTASFLPQGILFVVLTLMGTFYMSSDKERIFGFLRSLLPEKHRQRSNMFRASILRAVLGQIRAALIMLVVTFTELAVGFLLMKLDYAILFALVIAVLDALPVIGAGLFLIPMCIYGIVVGNVTLAVGAGLVYLMTIVVRQLLEPRIIGKQLGLYPLATMMAMYAGLHAMGFLGMILGPLILLLCKVALTANPDDATTAATHKPLFRKPSKREKKTES